MSPSIRSGAELACDVLQQLGVAHVFGLPGTQNVSIYEALRRSTLRTVVATHELSATMMANGYYRSSGRLAALVTIPGPGFTWALTGLAEASLDSAALLHLVGEPPRAPGTCFQLQAIDQPAIARPLVKAVHRIGRFDEIGPVLAAAHAQALAGEPGPVLVQIARVALEARAVAPSFPTAAADMPMTDAVALEPVVRAVAAARRCVILAGQGCHGAADLLARLAERLSAAVVTTTSGRGAVAEDHPLSLGFELAGTGAGTLNALIATSDLVLAIGCKFSHNGSRGFGLHLQADKLIHIDAAPEVLEANYPARLARVADARAFMAALLAALDGMPPAGGGFAAGEVAQWRERGRAESAAELVEPRLHGMPSGQAAEFFALLRRLLPRDACLVTDSGLHQMLARRHYPVLHPRGLLTPTNFQSMGFGIGAAIGACLADPARPVVALIGDGGLAMSGLELLAAVRARARLTVIVFVDGAYGLIRAQQLAANGRAWGTEFTGPDVAALAATVRAAHVRLEREPEALLGSALAADGVTLVEVGVGDACAMHRTRMKGLVSHALGPRARWLKRVLRGR